MIRFTHISAAAAVMVIFCAGAAVAAQPKEKVEQVTTTLPTLNPGQTAWVSTLWRGASTNATSFELTARGEGVSISYPENTGSYSSLYKQSTLLAGDTDYAALKVHVGDDVREHAEIKLTVKYELAGKKVNESGELTLPVEVVKGPAVEQVTTSVGPIKAGSAGWVDVKYKANKPGVTDARLTVTAPAGASVIYPNEGSSSGLAGDSSLAVGETDHASFRIDTGTLAPGSHKLELVLSYGGGQRLPGTATLVVN